MSRTLLTIAIAVALLVLVVAAAGCGPSEEKKAEVDKAKAPVSAVCPVMGAKIPDVSKAAGKSVYKGKTYYFCCPGCKPEFDKNPEKYINKKK